MRKNEYEENELKVSGAEKNEVISKEYIIRGLSGNSDKQKKFSITPASQTDILEAKVNCNSNNLFD